MTLYPYSCIFHKFPGASAIECSTRKFADYPYLIKLGFFNFYNIIKNCTISVDLNFSIINIFVSESTTPLS